MCPLPARRCSTRPRTVFGHLAAPLLVEIPRLVSCPRLRRSRQPAACGTETRTATCRRACQGRAMPGWSVRTKILYNYITDRARAYSLAGRCPPHQLWGGEHPPHATRRGLWVSPQLRDREPIQCHSPTSSAITASALPQPHEDGRGLYGMASFCAAATRTAMCARRRAYTSL